MNRWHTLRALGVATLFLLPSTVSADAMPPNAMACESRGVGATCMLEGAIGTCVASRCSRLDYEGWDRDASMTPPTIEVDCVVCNTSTMVDGGMGTTTPPPGSCSASHGGSAAPWAAALMVLGLALRARRTA